MNEIELKSSSSSLYQSGKGKEKNKNISNKLHVISMENPITTQEVQIVQDQNTCNTKIHENSSSFSISDNYPTIIKDRARRSKHHPSQHNKAKEISTILKSFYIEHTQSELSTRFPRASIRLFLIHSINLIALVLFIVYTACIPFNI